MHLDILSAPTASSMVSGLEGTWHSVTTQSLGRERGTPRSQYLSVPLVYRSSTWCEEM